MASDGDDRGRRGWRASRDADIGDERWFALGGAPDAGGQAQRLYLYEMTGSELPIADFRGEFRIREGRPHRCTVIWTGQFHGDLRSGKDGQRQGACVLPRRSTRHREAVRGRACLHVASPYEDTATPSLISVAASEYAAEQHMLTSTDATMSG